MSNTLHYLLSTFQPCHVCGCLIALPYAKFMHIHISNVTCVCLFVFPVMNYVDGLIFMPLVIFSARKFPPRVFFFLSSKFVSLLCFPPVCAVQPHHTHTQKVYMAFIFLLLLPKLVGWSFKSVCTRTLYHIISYTFCEQNQIPSRR